MPAAPPRTCRRAGGSDSTWWTPGEHLFFHGPTANAFVTLAAAAAVTERIRLLERAHHLPPYPMAMAAKLTATLDQLSAAGSSSASASAASTRPSSRRAASRVAGRGRAPTRPSRS